MDTKAYTIIGLTGNIGSGKSMALQMLRHMGAYGIDADEVAHKTYQQPDTSAAIRAQFGNLDRSELAQVVFNDPKALADLEAIIHPAVTNIVQTLIATAALPVIVIEAIKLLESDLAQMCDSIWVVDADNATVMQRLQTQRGMDAQAISARLANQSPITVKKKRADTVIENDGDRESTWHQILAGWKEIIDKECKTNVKETIKQLMAPLDIHLVRPYSAKHKHMRSLLKDTSEAEWIPDRRRITSSTLDAWICDRFVLHSFINKERRSFFGWKMGTFDCGIDAITQFRSEGEHVPIPFEPMLAETLGQIFHTERINLPVPKVLSADYETSLKRMGFKPESETSSMSAEWNKAGYNVFNKRFWDLDAYLKGK